MILRIASWARRRIERVALQRQNELDPTCSVGRSDLCRSRVGRHTDIDAGCDICDTDIGSFSQIARGVVIAPRNHVLGNFTIHDAPYNRSESQRILGTTIWDDRFRARVGHDVWIGQNAILLHGVEIGNGAVIGAGAVVTRSVPPYAIVAGNPARIVRRRLSEAAVKRLQELKWWEWPISTIRERRFELEALAEFNLDAWLVRHGTPRRSLT